MYLNVIAQAESMTLEALNMQLEAEAADIIDRGMIQLFGIKSQKLDKLSAQNLSKKMNDVKEGTMTASPSKAAAAFGDQSPSNIDILRNNNLSQNLTQADSNMHLQRSPSESNPQFLQLNNSSQFLESNINQQMPQDISHAE